MNQPTEDRLKHLEEEQRQLKEEVQQLRQWKEQHTEEIKAVRVEVASEDVVKRLDTLKQDLTKELHTISNTWLETLQEHYTEHIEAISDVKTVQSGHSKFFEEHGKRLAATATKDDLTALKATQDTRFDRIEGLIMQLLQQRSEEE